MMRLRLAALAAVTLLGTAASRAEEGDLLTGTIKTVHDRGSILIGYRESAPPFAFLNKAGQPIGFSVDLCHAIAEDIAATLNSPLLDPGAPEWQTGIRVRYVPVAAEARLPMLVAGSIDLECGSTTANAERAKTIAFSPIFFLAGTRLLAPASAGTASYRSLAGRTIVVGAGTTNAPVIHRLASTVAPPITVTEVPNLDAAYALLDAGKADAFASDDILLAGFRATKPDGRRFDIVGDYLSYEPYAIGYRRDDPALAALVTSSFQHLAAAGRLSALYATWFTDRLPSGETMALPMSAQLTEMYRALGQPD